MRTVPRAGAVIAREAAVAAGTLLAASALLFVAAEVLPGDAAAAALGADATPARLAAARLELGLDDPWPVRYGRWLAGVLHGDLGASLVSGKPVAAVIGGPLADTALLALLAVGVTVAGALAVGLACGLHPGGPLDRVLSGLSVASVSVPPFVVAGVLVLVFAGWIPVLPAVSLVPFGGGALDRPEILVLPVVTLGLFATAWAGRTVRALVVDANASPHVEAARLAGLPEHRVVLRHLLPTVAAPLAQMFGWLVGAQLGGTAVVERVFDYPGLSAALVDAVEHHDAPVLLGVGLLLAAVVVAGLLVADGVAVLLDPRARTS